MKDYTPKIDPIADAKGFKLYGIEFRCRPKLPFRVIAEFTTALSSSAQVDTEDAKAGLGEIEKMLKAVDRFFQRAISSQDQYAQWVALQEDDERVVDLETLMEIASDLAEAYSGNALTGEQSPGGTSATPSPGVASMVGAPSGPLTYSRPEQTAPLAS